jgi:hypothetical protein
MSDKPSVTIAYSEPQMPQFHVRSLDDLRNGLMWLGVIPRIYSGQVHSGGTAGSPFPSGWSVSGSGGSYTVTHNLGTTNYVVVANSVTSGGNVLMIVDSKNADDFTVLAKNAGNPANTDWNFILHVIP